jgi:hypothetical protein
MDDFLLNFKVDLTLEQLHCLIKDAVSRKYPEFSVEKVDFKTEAEYDMRGEYCGTKFKGVTLKLLKK